MVVSRLEPELLSHLRVVFGSHGVRAVEYLETAERFLDEMPIVGPRLGEVVAYCIREALTEIPKASGVGADSEWRQLSREVVRTFDRYDDVGRTAADDELQALSRHREAVEKLREFHEEGEGIHEARLFALMMQRAGVEPLSTSTGASPVSEYRLLVADANTAAHDSCPVDAARALWERCVALLRQLFLPHELRSERLIALAAIDVPTLDDLREVLRLSGTSVHVQRFLRHVSTPWWLQAFTTEGALGEAGGVLWGAACTAAMRLADAHRADVVAWLNESFDLHADVEGHARCFAHAAHSVGGDALELLLRIVRRYPEDRQIVYSGTRWLVPRGGVRRLGVEGVQARGVNTRLDLGGPGMGPDLDTLATALYVRVDDLLAENPDWAPKRPRVGIAPKLSDAELVTLAVISALLGYDNESQFVRYAHEHLRPWFPYLPNRDGYNKRLRGAAETIVRVIAALACECVSWHDDVWLVDSTPVGCGTSRETAKRSALADWAEYGWCASHSRWFWGLRLHLVATPAGLPVMFSLAGAKADEREVCADMIDRAGLARPGQTLIADKGYRSKTLETDLNSTGITVLRPATRTETPRPGAKLLRPLSQIIESINWTLKGQLTLERHKGRTRSGVAARIATRLLALTAAIWHNETHHPHRPPRTLTLYDH